MKTTKQNWSCAAGALLVLAGFVGDTAAQETKIDAIVYCKAIITPSGDMTDPVLAVELPPTPGRVDPNGNPVTIWELGEVAAGGVADSWHDGGPGLFQVRNVGNVSAYVYVTAMSAAEFMNEPSFVWEWVFGSDPMSSHPRPQSRIAEVPGEPVAPPEGMSFHLALTTDVTAVAPTWSPLGHCSYYQNGVPYWLDRQCSAYLAWMPAGEYQPFDLKFWAPLGGLPPEPFGFAFRVEAASFPMWEHDR